MKTNKTFLCAITLAAAPAWATDAGHWYFTPQVGGIHSDDDRGLEQEGWLYGLAVGRHLDDRWSLELDLNTASLVAPADLDVDLQAASLNVLRVFARDRAVSPYLTLGAGALRLDPNRARTQTDFMTEAGVGLMLRLGENERGTGTFSLRPEIKARWDDAGAAGHLVDYVATLGFQISFGSQPPRNGAVVESAAAPAAVSAPPAPVQAAPPPPADSDGDGVVDSEDRCPNTPRGTLVDTRGCPQQSSITLQGVTFEVNSAELMPQSKPVLARVAADLAKHPELRVEVEAHTDSSGSDSYNLQLSQRRAEAVRDYMVSQGVAAKQLEARGYGEARPIADNGTAEGRARNRRAVMRVIENPGGV